MGMKVMKTVLKVIDIASLVEEENKKLRRENKKLRKLLSEGLGLIIRLEKRLKHNGVNELRVKRRLRKINFNRK